MKRLEFCKYELKKALEVKNDHDLMELYQELNNYLPTYREKKELSLFYYQLKTKEKEKV